MKKICKNCGVEKEYSEYYSAPGMKDGHRSVCRQCSSKKSLEWNQNNPERKRASNRKWHASHSEYNANKAKAWRGANQERYRANIDKWNESHQDKYLNYPKERRARINNAPVNDFTQKQWEQIKAAYNYRCAYCGKKTKLTRDHIIPLSKGGSHTMSNIVPACIKCNCSKSNNDAPVYQPVLSVELLSLGG